MVRCRNLLSNKNTNKPEMKGEVSGDASPLYFIIPSLIVRIFLGTNYLKKRFRLPL